MPFVPLQSAAPKQDGFTPLTATPKAEADKRDILQKVRDFIVEHDLPGSQIGGAIGDQLGALYEAGKSALKGNTRVAKQILDSTPSPDFEKVVGDAIRSVITPASLAVGGEGGLAANVGKFAALGAGEGAGESMAKGNGADVVLKDSLESGAAGGAAGLASHVIASAVSSIGQNLPTRLIRDLTKQPKPQLRAGKDVAPIILADKRVGTMEGLIKDAQANIEDIGAQIHAHLAAATADGTNVTRDELYKAVSDAFNSKGAALDPEQVSSVISTLAPQVKGLLAKDTLTLAEANQVRSALDRTLGDKAFLTSQLPFNKDVLKEFSDTLRSTVKEKGPAQLRGLFEEQSKEIRLRNALSEASLAESRKNFVTWRDILSAGLGASLGGLPGVIGGVALERGLSSAPFITGSAVGIDTLHKSLGPILTKLAPAERALVTSLIARAFANGGEQTQASQAPQASPTQ